MDRVSPHTGRVRYRGKRQRILEIACGSAKNWFPELTTVVGIAIDVPYVAVLAQKEAEEGIGAALEHRLRSKHRWFYLLSDVADHAKRPRK